MNSRNRIHENTHMVRLDDATEERLKKIARRDGIAPAVLCRSAIREFIRRDEVVHKDNPTKEIIFSRSG